MGGNVLIVQAALWLRLTLVLVLGLVLVGSVCVYADQAQYNYDDLGRLVQVVDGQGNVATYNYDAVGNLLSLTRNTGGCLHPASDERRCTNDQSRVGGLPCR